MVSSNIKPLAWKCCKTAFMSLCHSRAKKKEREGGSVNLGCIACRVRITIFSVALLHPSICSITIYCRERGGGRSKIVGEGRGGGREDVLSDAGDEEVNVKELD